MQHEVTSELQNNLWWTNDLMFQQQLGPLECLYCSKQPKRIIVISSIGCFLVNSKNKFAFSTSWKGNQCRKPPWNWLQISMGNYKD